MGLVDDDRVVAAQQRVALDLGQQDAVGHELDQGGGAHLVGEAHLVAHLVAQVHAHFVAQALGDSACGDPARLGVADHALDTAAELQADLGDLGGLARSRLAGHHHHLVVADRGGDLVTARGDRELLGVADRRDRGAAGGDLLGGERGALLGVVTAGAAGSVPTAALAAALAATTVPAATLVATTVLAATLVVAATAPAAALVVATVPVLVPRVARAALRVVPSALIPVPPVAPAVLRTARNFAVVPARAAGTTAPGLGPGAVGSTACGVVPRAAPSPPGGSPVRRPRRFAALGGIGWLSHDRPFSQVVAAGVEVIRGPSRPRNRDASHRPTRTRRSSRM